MENILEMPSVKDYNDNLGVATLHPLVSVVDMSYQALAETFWVLLHNSQALGMWRCSIWS